MSRELLLSSLLVFSVGCASAGNGLRAEGPAVRMGQRAAEPLVVTHTYITGPSSSLRLREDGMHGRFRDQLVSLKWDYQKVTGMLGTRPTHLELSEGDDTRVVGSFGGSPVHIFLKGEWLVARVGPCAYSLRRTPGGYTGERDCPGAREEPFLVDFPEFLQERPLGQMATLLALAFVDYTDTYSSSASIAGSVPVRSITKGRRQGPY
jgi:hypothetical protein